MLAPSAVFRPPALQPTHVGAVLSTRPHDGGSHQYALSVLSGLARMDGGPDVSVFTTLEPDLPADVAALFPPIRAFMPAAPEAPPAVTLAQRLLGESPLRHALRRARRSLARPPRIDPEQVHARPDAAAWIDATGLDWTFYTTATSLAFEAGRPYVVPVHDLQHRLQPHFPEVSAGGEWDWREYLFRNLTRYATLVLVDSEVGRDDALEFYGPHGLTEDRVRVLPFSPPSYLNPVPSVRARARLRVTHALPERYLFYPAQFWPHKNHLRLVQALALLKERGERVHLVFSGACTGAHREQTFARMMREAARRRVEAQVHVLGYVPNADMSALYAEAAGVVMPTFFGPTNIPVVEAWTFGKPLLTSDIRGVREQVGDAGLLADPTSVEALAEGMHRLWTDAALAADLAARGRARLATRAPEAFDRGVASVVAEATARVCAGDAPFSGRRAART